MPIPSREKRELTSPPFERLAMPLLDRTQSDASARRAGLISTALPNSGWRWLGNEIGH
jgi:hypothetical protein